MPNIQKIRLNLPQDSESNESSAANVENTTPLKVGLVQVNNSFSGQNYLPYAAGLLQSYVEKHARHPERYTFALPIYSRIQVPVAVERLAECDVVGFSVYVWNIRISLEIARRLRAARPDVLIVFGGPQVPDRAEEFLQKNRQVDIAVHGEGEPTFLSILENFPSRTWGGLKSVSYVTADGKFVNSPRADRMRDITTIPSPYLEGVFEPLMKANPEEKWLILWETNRGCPFQCTFCDWGSAIAAKVSQFEIERLFKEVDWFAEKQIEFIFCCDANYGMLARDYELTQYVANKKAISGYPKALSVQNTKNGTERAYKVQKLLADAGLNKGVAISLQSVDPGTLEAIKRQNISTNSFQELQRRFTRDRIETYSDLILGLPGETYNSFADGIARVIDNGQHNRIQFNNLSILPNAEMGDPEYQKKHGLVTVETKIINIHGALAEAEDEFAEVQQLVVATKAMPREDWIKTRSLCWIAALLHFDKVMQIPIILLREQCEVGYREIFEAFISDRVDQFPVLAEIRNFFFEKAKDIQQGGAEYCHSPQWLDIYWPADEYILIKLCVENRLGAFYEQSEEMINTSFSGKLQALPANLLHEAMSLNRALIKLPFQKEDICLKTSFNIWDYYRAALVGEKFELKPQTTENRIARSKAAYSSWDDWYREVIWYGNKKGAYLYGNDVSAMELAGHY
jgi:radical SAM superfamily enzyme YgiQ (UPF0313 family)